MHVSIPDTREVTQSSSFLLYNIHINGLHHCSLRYKQLLHFHTQLSRCFGSHNLPSFPPKKLLPLSKAQVEERRLAIEKYLQTICQDKTISNSDIFNNFLLEAQRESSGIQKAEVSIDVELVNGQKIRLNIVSHESADAVLVAVCRSICLNERYHAYFCLCLCGYDVITDKLMMKRRLCCFESPYLTLQTAYRSSSAIPNGASNARQCSSSDLLTSSNLFASGDSQRCSHASSHRIVLRKAYWDPIYDTCAYLIDDRQALNLLFIHSVYDISQKLIPVDKETQHQLRTFLAINSKREYVLLARTLKYYNYLHYESCISDYPRPNTKCLISIGNRELNMRTLAEPNPDTITLGGYNHHHPSHNDERFSEEVEEEFNFKVPRIRCWRLTSLEPRPAASQYGGIRGSLVSSSSYTNVNASDGQKEPQYELSFEYLMAKDTLKWITITSDQAIYISVSIQEVVDELVSKRDGLAFRGTVPPSDGSKRVNGAPLHANLTYMTRDGSCRASREQRLQKWTAQYASGYQNQINRHYNQRPQNSPMVDVSMMKRTPRPIVNDAFEGGIGDEDL